jgi:predicted transcriptional regulator of viral defense system
MKLEKPVFKSLSELVDYLQSNGDYVFTQKTAKSELKCSSAAIRIAANRLMTKQRIVKLRYTLYLIVPLEYKSAGAPPPPWYIDALMQHHNQPYYVALLSAAALHGAAHQQPQVFQVMTNKPLRFIVIGRVKIAFIVKKDIEKYEVVKMKTATGYMNVSIPEATTFDLVRYITHAGYLSNIATVLTELSEKINPDKLLALAKHEKLIMVQRTGFLLARYAKKNVTQPLLKWLKTQKTHITPLRTDRAYKNSPKDKNWQVAINEEIEVDI